MQDLIFYDFDFNRLNDFRKCISVNWTLNFCGYGSFEAHFPLSQTRLIDMLDKNRYLLCVQGENQAVVTGWRVDEDIAVFGNTPEWLMTKRAVNVFCHANAYPTQIVNYIMNTRMNDFVTVTPVTGMGSMREYSLSEVRTVYDTVCELLKKDSLGFRLFADVESKTFRFETRKAKECLTLISSSNKSAHSMAYTCEMQNAATNSGWYKRKPYDKGEWNAQTNQPYLASADPKQTFTYYKIISDTYTRFGLVCTKGSYIYSDTADGSWKISEARPDAVWVYVDNSSLSGAKKWDCVLEGERTEDEALLQISERKVSETVEAEIRRLEYGKDYSLGDRVRVQFEKGDFKKTFTKTVDGVRIFYDVDKTGVCPILSE